MRFAFLLCAFSFGLSLPAQAPAAKEAADDPNTIVDPALFAHLHYRCVGPTRGGRVTAVAGVEQEPGTFYLGACGGGVWKTTDYGVSWANVSDRWFETGSIGAIRVARKDPNIVWVGTGSDGLRSNVIAGKGVYKSTDAGKTWQRAGLREVGQIGAVEIDPQNPDVVWVAAIGMAFGPTPDRGVYKTEDGGATWKKVLFISETCGASDLELNPANPDEVYASAWRGERKPWTIISGGDEGGVYKSTDGGKSWNKLSKGLPQGIVGKSDLAVTPADHDLLYVLIEAPPPDGGVYRSRDRGESFELVSTQSGLLDRPFYYCNIDLDPRDADVVWVNSTSLHKSTDGGKTWQRAGTPHGDNHDIWIHPERTEVMIQSNDGGANVTTDGGRTWSTQRNQPTAELYQLAVDDRWPYWLYAGQQDSTTVRVPSAPVRGYDAGPNGTLESVGGCETGPAVPKPGDPDIVYAACKGRFGVFNARTGQEQQHYVGYANMYGHNPKDLEYRFQRVAPIHVSPHGGNVVYHCSQYVHRTTDDGRTWETISPDLTAFEPDKQVISGEPITRDITGEEFYSTLYAIRESPREKGLIWVGSNDGPIHVTRDAGGNWKNVTPRDLPPGGRVQNIEPSPHDAAKAYVAVYRYLLGDWQPYVYRTTDYGATWTRLTTGRNGIPDDYPTRVVREDPDRAGLLYVGTEFGMYVSFDDGAHWQSLQLDLPRTPVTDIVVHRQDLVLSTMGRSFWILDNVTPLQQLGRQVASAPAVLFAPRVAYRVQGGRGGFGRGQGDSAGRVPEYAPPGAQIDYWLAADHDGDVKLEILDPEGEVVASWTGSEPSRGDEAAAGGRSGRETRRAAGGEPRRAAGGEAPERAGGEEEGSDEVTGEMLRGRGRERGRGGPAAARLEQNAGAHRFVWDLRGRGGTVAPGSYQVRLTAGGTPHTAALTVEIDPRLAAEGITAADIRAQQEFVARLDAAQARARALTAKVRDWRRRLADIIAQGGADAAAAKRADERLAALQGRLAGEGGRYPQPMLSSQLSYLSNVGRADQAPGNHAEARLASLTQELESCEKAFAGIEGPAAEAERRDN